MNSIFKKSIGAALVTTMLVPALPALAQGLDEIVVTAQRREQNLLDVPIAVTSFDAAALEAAGVIDILDLNHATSSVFINIQSSPLSNSPIRIRGIGTVGGNPGFESSVGIYVDEVYRSRPGAAISSLYDMAGLDVLRGPQGTLFGKNTTAGALILKSTAPELGENSGYLTLDVGNYGVRSVEAAYNYAIGDNSALRVSIVSKESDGYFNDGNGTNTAQSENEGVRVQYYSELNDRTDIRVIADYNRLWGNGDYSTSGPIFSPQPITLPAFSYTIPLTHPNDDTILQKGLSATINYEINDNLSFKSITSYRELDSDNQNGDWDFIAIDPFLTATNPRLLQLIGALPRAAPLLRAFPGSDLNKGQALNVFHDIETFTQEFLLEGATGDLDYVAGFNYFSEDIAYLRQGSTGNFLFGRSGVFFQDLTQDQEETSYGIFAHGTYAIDDQWSLIGGLRYNDIEKTVDYKNLVANGDAYSAFAQTNAAGLWAAGAALATAWDYTQKVSNDEFTYNLSLQFRPDEDTQLFAGYSRGFKAGGFNLTENAGKGVPIRATAPFNPMATYPTGQLFINADGTPHAGGGLPRHTLRAGLIKADGTEFVAADIAADVHSFTTFDPSLAAFRPEFVDAYEVGYRLEYGDNRGRLSVVGFYSDYEDLQVTYFTGQVFNVLNAGSSTTQGVEIENLYAVSEELTLNTSFTFLEASYGADIEYLTPNRDRGNSPEFTGVIGLRYEKDLKSDAQFYSNVNYSYRTESFLAEGENGTALAAQKQDAYGLLGFSVGVKMIDAFDISISCSNCLDEQYYDYAFNQPFDGPALLGQARVLGDLGDPRTFGLRLKTMF